MNLFKLPHSTTVNKVIPKNAFEEYANSKQKRQFTDLVSRITWAHKLSPDTVNLEAFKIKEIQIFEVELKIREDIQAILDVIDKSIPYHIVFIVAFDGEVYISTSIKHPHPADEDRAVIDWTFKSGWFSPIRNKYTLQLRKCIDAILHNLCIQLSENIRFLDRPIMELVEYIKSVSVVEREISDINSKMANAKQFNEKVQLNLLLKQKQAELDSITRPWKNDSTSS